jgi:hypothetical protein
MISITSFRIRSTLLRRRKGISVQQLKHRPQTFVGEVFVGYLRLSVKRL